MCKELCESGYGEMQSCQDCGKLICFDIPAGCGDDVMQPAAVTSSGDLFCVRCAVAHDRAEEEEFDEPWEQEMAMEDIPIPEFDLGGEG
jgi:hypothetical protein